MSLMEGHTLSIFFLGAGCGALADIIIDMITEKEKEEKELSLGVPLIFFLLSVACRIFWE